jgi:hypothetical protein
MTTRRWMIAVAIAALSLGASLYAVRLKRKRDSCLARATWHSTMEADALRSLARLPAQSIHADPEPAPMTNNELDWAIDRVLGIPIERRRPSEGNDRIREYRQVLRQATAPSRRRVVADYLRRESERLRKQVDRHAALARKYRHAARNPWLPIEPDPAEPQ